MLDVALWVFYRFQEAGVEYQFSQRAEPPLAPKSYDYVIEANPQCSVSAAPRSGWAPPASYHHRRGRR